MIKNYNKNQKIKYVNTNYKKINYKRKIVHLLTGIIFMLLLSYLNKSFSIIFFTTILIIGIILSILDINHRIWFISKALDLFDKESDRLIMPGKGLIMYVAGTLISLLFFDKSIVIIGVFVLAIGDPIATIFGNLFGRLPAPWNKTKHLDGSIIATIICGLILSIYMNNYLFFIPVALGMTIETMPLHKLGLDDNFLIPIIVTLISALI